MEKPTIILATSNGVGMGHLVRATAIATALKEYANPIIVSMASGIAEIPDHLGIRVSIFQDVTECGCHVISGIFIYVIVYWL